MKPTMAARIRALQDMTVPELRGQYREVFGEETRSRLDAIHLDAVYRNEV